MRRAAEQEGFIRPRPGAAVAPARTLPDRPSGAALIYSHVPTLPNGPGVYRMLDAKGDVLYVGKAKSLKKRLPAYAKPSGLSARLQRMVALTHGIEVVTTASDVEALLLECNMIKRHRPPFNIVLRDDKSFPYIYVGKAAASSRFRGSGGIAAPSARTATISVRSRRPARSTRRSPPSCALSRCAPAPTAFFTTAPGPACNTRSSAARRLASGGSGRPTMRSCSSRRGRSWPGAATPSRISSRRRWRRPPNAWNSSRRRRSAID